MNHCGQPPAATPLPLAFPLVLEDAAEDLGDHVLPPERGEQLHRTLAHVARAPGPAGELLQADRRGQVQHGVVDEPGQRLGEAARPRVDAGVEAGAVGEVEPEVVGRCGLVGQLQRLVDVVAKLQRPGRLGRRRQLGDQPREADPLAAREQLVAAEPLGCAVGEAQEQPGRDALLVERVVVRRPHGEAVIEERDTAGGRVLARPGADLAAHAQPPRFAGDPLGGVGEERAFGGGGERDAEHGVVLAEAVALDAGQPVPPAGGAGRHRKGGGGAEDAEAAGRVVVLDGDVQARRRVEVQLVADDAAPPAEDRVAQREVGTERPPLPDRVRREPVAGEQPVAGPEQVAVAAADPRVLRPRRDVRGGAAEERQQLALDLLDLPPVVARAEPRREVLAGGRPAGERLRRESADRGQNRLETATVRGSSRRVAGRGRGPLHGVDAGEVLVRRGRRVVAGEVEEERRLARVAGTHPQRARAEHRRRGLVLDDLGAPGPALHAGRGGLDAGARAECRDGVGHHPGAPRDAAGHELREAGGLLQRLPAQLHEANAAVLEDGVVDVLRHVLLVVPQRAVVGEADRCEQQQLDLRLVGLVGVALRLDRHEPEPARLRRVQPQVDAVREAGGLAAPADGVLVGSELRVRAEQRDRRLLAHPPQPELRAAGGDRRGLEAVDGERAQREPLEPAGRQHLRREPGGVFEPRAREVGRGEGGEVAHPRRLRRGLPGGCCPAGGSPASRG